MKNKFVCSYLDDCQKYEACNEVCDRIPEVRRHSSAPRIVVCPPIDETTSPRTGLKLLQVITRRIGRTSPDDSASTSSDSGDHSSTSESGSVSSENQRRKRLSTSSLRKVLKNLSISPRSHSCDQDRKPKKNPQPKKILRPPVTYTYVKGLSGLPTQRIPRPITVSGLSR